MHECGAVVVLGGGPVEQVGKFLTEGLEGSFADRGIGGGAFLPNEQDFYDVGRLFVFDEVATYGSYEFVGASTPDLGELFGELVELACFHLDFDGGDDEGVVFGGYPPTWGS